MPEAKALSQSSVEGNTAGDTMALGDHVPFTLRSSHMARYIATMSPERREAFEVEMAQIQARIHYQKVRSARQLNLGTQDAKSITRLTLTPPDLLDPSKSVVDQQIRSLIQTPQAADAQRDLQNRCQYLISEILKSTHQRARVLQLPKQDVQPMVDYLDVVSRGTNTFGTSDRKLALVLLFSLVKSTQLLPRSYQLTEVEYERNPVEFGGFVNIYKGEYKGQAVCIKALRFHLQENEPAIQISAAEVVLWAHLRHKNVLPFYGIFLLGDTLPRLCLVSPWMAQGNLLNYINKFPRSPRMDFISDILDGLSYLHDLQIVHGDLKATNILVSEDGNALITDFGLSSIATTSQLNSDTRIGGTSNWTAPELLIREQELQATKPSDIWSFACLCYEILARKNPFYQYTTDASLIFAMMRKELPLRPTPSDEDVSGEINDQMWSLLVTCWNYVPEDRPTCQDLQKFVRSMVIRDERKEVTKEAEASVTLDIRREPSYAGVDYARVEEILLQLSAAGNAPVNLPKDTEHTSAFHPQRGAVLGTKNHPSENLDKERQILRVVEQTQKAQVLPHFQHLPKDIESVPCKKLDGRVQRPNDHIFPDHSGGFAEVFIGYLSDDKKTRIKVAIKVLRVSKDEDRANQLTKYLIRETVVWQRLDHPNVLPFFGLAYDLGYFGLPALISPYCENGTVVDYLRIHPEIDTRFFIIRGVCEGLRYLHKQGVVHGDPKPSNILVHDDGHPLLCDFGRSRILDQPGYTTKPGGACRYQAPELLQGIGPNKATDVYAFAHSSYEIWTGLRPFHTIHRDTTIILDIIMREARPEYPDPEPPGTGSLWEIFKKCWRTEPEERLTIEQVMQELAKISLPTP